MSGNIGRVSSYYVFSFHWVDRPWPFFKLEDELSDPICTEIRRRVGKWFDKIGWNREGDIEVYWLMPWMTGMECGNCEAAYHVKQDENGTSFFAVPKSFGFIIDEDIPGVSDVLSLPLIESLDHVMTFGKWKGHTVNAILANQGSEYIEWLIQNDVVEFSRGLVTVNGLDINDDGFTGLHPFA